MSLGTKIMDGFKDFHLFILATFAVLHFSGSVPL